jgi:D-serine deaminase-like pyridoxal phosphate-dependent protein
VRITELATPQVLIDRHRVLHNIDRMQAAASGGNLRLRPHAKTHKSPVVARWQIERGAVGICCAKLGEAEVFAAAGITDIRLPYPLHPSNAPRVLALMKQARISSIVDHLAIAESWSDAMRAAGTRLDVLVKVDVGFHRCGIDPRSPGTIPFIRRVAELPGLNLRGLLSHAGHAYNAPSEEAIAVIARHEALILRELAQTARLEGVPIEELSVGATPTARFSVTESGLTEIRPGNYVYFDRSQVGLGAARLEQCALTVLARVVSKPAADRIILDSGSKTLSSDGARGSGSPAGYGAVLSAIDANTIDPALVVERLSEEHATVRVTTRATSLEPGDLVRIVPNHSCVVSNLVDAIQVVDGLEVLGILPVAARGRIN